MIAYVRYTERECIGRYLLVFLFLCLALMAKPMAVTLPFVLLLLDYWPLGRFESKTSNERKSCPQSEKVKVAAHSSSVWRLIAEKIPLFVPVVAISVITYIAQQQIGIMAYVDKLSIKFRIYNCLVSYIGYLLKMLYPSRLTVLYPHPLDTLPLWQPIICGIILAVISSVVFYAGRQKRYLLTGWLWYLGTLVPVIGLVQVGSQAMADRYTYLPSIGIFIMLGWGSGELLARWRYKKIVFGITASVVVAVLLVLTRLQTGNWEHSLSLFGHSLDVTENNFVAHINYGNALCEEERYDEAFTHFSEALHIKPGSSIARINVGKVFLKKGRYDKAVVHLSEVLSARPDWADAYYFLGLAYHLQDNYEAAIQKYQEALHINPDLADAHSNLGQIFVSNGDLDGAIKHYTEALRLRGDDVNTMNNLAWVLATAEDTKYQNPAEAVKLAERACELTRYEQSDLLDTLAVAYASSGRFEEAIEVSEKAIELAKMSGQKDLADEIQSRLQLYQAGQPYHKSRPAQNNVVR